MEKINKLKKIFKREKIDGYIIPKMMNFLVNIFQITKIRLNYISNFQDLMVCLILKNKNYLFVDGRYTLQAKTKWKIFKIITIPDKMPSDILKKKINNWFDPNYLQKKL